MIKTTQSTLFLSLFFVSAAMPITTKADIMDFAAGTTAIVLSRMSSERFTSHKHALELLKSGKEMTDETKSKIATLEKKQTYAALATVLGFYGGVGLLGYGFINI